MEYKVQATMETSMGRWAEVVVKVIYHGNPSRSDILRCGLDLIAEGAINVHKSEYTMRDDDGWVDYYILKNADGTVHIPYDRAESYITGLKVI